MTKKFDDFVKALEELCRAHKVVLMPDINGDLQVFDVDDSGDTIYPFIQDLTTYNWIDANEHKPDGEKYVDVCYEHNLFSAIDLFSVGEARWVPANTVVVEQPDETTEDSYPSRLRYVFVNQEPYVYEIFNYQPEGWYDVEGKPLTHKVTHWRYKND